MSNEKNGKDGSKPSNSQEEEAEDEIFQEAITYDGDKKKDDEEAKPGGGKKVKTLRFNIDEKPEPAGGGTQSDSRYEESDWQHPGGFRASPLRFVQSGRVSDVMRALHADVTEDESGSSLYFDTENRLAQPEAFAYKATFDALRRSPTKSQADFHLLMSTYLRNLEGVILALESGANVNVVQDMQTPLIIATENNDVPLVEYFLGVDGINLDAQNVFGCTALVIALKNGFDKIATSLVKNRARLDISDNFHRTPLHEALFMENYEMVKLLIDHHHQLEVQDSFGEKPIYTCSVKKPNLRMLNLLLDAGASCEYENETGLSLLSRAIANSTSFPVIKRLVLAGADVNHQDHFCKRTPLHMASIIDSSPIAKLLIEHGADPDHRTIAGLTPFDLALYYRCFAVAEYLAIYTKNPSLTLGNFKDSLISRLPKHGSALFLLRIKTARNYTIRRCILHVPANDTRKIQHALQLRVDSISFSLFSNQSEQFKDHGRKLMSELLNEKNMVDNLTEFCIRVHPVQFRKDFLSDIDAILSAKNLPHAILIPHLNSYEQVRWFVEEVLKRIMIRARESRGPIDLLLEITSPKAVMRLPQLCKATQMMVAPTPLQLSALIFGYEELRKHLGTIRVGGGMECIYSRQKIVLVAKAFGLQAIDLPLAGQVSENEFKVTCEDGLVLGFTGKMVLEPGHITLAQSIFNPSRSRVHQCRHILEDYALNESSENAGNDDGFKRVQDLEEIEVAKYVLEVSEFAKQYKT